MERSYIVTPMDARLIARPVRPWRVPTRLWVAGFAAFSSLLTVPLARAAPVAYDFEQEADTAGWTAPGATDDRSTPIFSH